MPMVIRSPSSASIINIDLLSPENFSPFGTVIQNPDPTLLPSNKATKDLPPNVLQANQGTALKYQNVTDMLDLYDEAPSGKSSRAVMNLFVCAPRSLLKSPEPTQQGFFPVDILERHPFTTQTFTPLGLSSLPQGDTFYLVVVAPSSSPSSEVAHLPVPASHKSTLGRKLPGRGLPDLTKIRAFIANGSQAVTYGAGTWHAPMVVIGKSPVDFVVVQFSNDVAAEDCQEILISSDSTPQIRVAIPRMSALSSQSTSKL